MRNDKEENLYIRISAHVPSRLERKGSGTEELQISIRKGNKIWSKTLLENKMVLF